MERTSAGDPNERAVDPGYAVRVDERVFIRDGGTRPDATGIGAGAVLRGTRAASSDGELAERIPELGPVPATRGAAET